MHYCHAAIGTSNASKYLQQLCKHFAHKVEVQFDTHLGRAELPPGRCMMSVAEGTLIFYCQSSKTEGLAVSKRIIDDHLIRFAWREEIEIEWTDGLPEDIPEGIRRELTET